ncbi:MAG TPA: ATPase [Clostridiales bacterium]|nr:ATPase [Clostridiales bacterium]
MEILKILDTLEDIVSNSTSVPLSGKCLVDRGEILDYIGELKERVPDDIKQAKWVKEERERILGEAKAQAQKIVDEAEGKVQALINDHEITKKAYEQANQTIADSQKNAREIRLGSREYADNLLAQIQDTLNKANQIIEKNREELK